MRNIPEGELWFFAGSQHLYGPEALQQVDQNAAQLAAEVNAAGAVRLPLAFRGVLTTPEEIRRGLLDATADDACLGVVVWMHTFSPAQMWIPGLKVLGKPLLHLHTQLSQTIPWSTIDMDYMNLHQSAHGDREFASVLTRLGVERKTVVGHCADPATLAEIDAWSRAALAFADAQRLRIARVGDNMRAVAITEGDKVEARAAFGYRVEGFGLGDMTRFLPEAPDPEIDRLCAVYADLYDAADDLRPGGARHESVREAARIEIGLRRWLDDVSADAFTDTFENLHGLRQLPGLAVQRLMSEGFGFGAEGDWKTAGLVRAAKVMADGLPGGTSFMEDYTYRLTPGDEMVLGAHMLEICPSIAKGRPRLAVEPLGIGGREDPARLIFPAAAGAGVNAGVVETAGRFAILSTRVELVDPPESLPNLPVAHALWRAEPDMRTATKAWLEAGGGHHTALSTALTMDHFRDLARVCGVGFEATSGVCSCC